MHKRFARALLAVPAAAFAGIGLMAGPALGAPAAKSAGPALGSPIATTAMAGYQASGRQFRWISSTLMVPDHQSELFNASCTITAAPHFTVTTTGGATGPLVIMDGSRTLSFGFDYTSPTLTSPPGVGPYVITLVDTGNWKAGDTLDTSAVGTTVSTSLPSVGTVGIDGSGNGTFVPSDPVATCGTLFLPTQITVFDTTAGHGLKQGVDYTIVKTGLFSFHLNMIASGNWDFGDKLKVTSLVWHSAYIQLSNGSLGTKAGQYVRTGIEPCAVAMNEQTWPSSATCPDGSWVAFIETFRNAMSPIPRFSHYVPLNVSKGDGVGFSIYYNLGGNELFFHITPPTPAPDIEVQVNAHGGIFNFAAALDDTTNTAGDPVVLPAFLTHVRVQLFVQGAITTVNGQKGSFVGPWTTRPVVATSNGLPFPSGSFRVVPTPLFSDGLPANGAVRPWDAFAVFVVT